MLNNLSQYTNSMKNHDRSISAFPINFQNHGFACIYVIDEPNSAIYISSLGENSFTFKVIVYPRFTYFLELGDNYKALCQYLNLRYDIDNKFSPRNFIQELDAYFPTEYNRHHACTTAEVSQVVDSYQNDEIKPYFCGWRNSENDTVSDNNYAKTLTLNGISHDLAIRLRQNHISSRWSANPDKERLELINQYNNI